MKEIPFTKMHGLGNDFVVLDFLQKDTQAAPSLAEMPPFARQLCDRRFGIGADQLLVLKQPQGLKQKPQCDVRMEIWNADGSEAEMCGNGIRAVALYLKKQGLTPIEASQPGRYVVETLAGIQIVEAHVDDTVTVNMGAPQLGGGFDPELSNHPGEALSTLDQKFSFYEVSMGNPHAVIFVPSALSVPLEKWGPAIETHPRFPKKTNVEFIEIKDPHTIQVRVWERGAGPTLACGTGACGAAVAALATGKVQNPLTVQLPGGYLRISWAGPGHPVMMTGPAAEVFRGVISINAGSGPRRES